MDKNDLFMHSELHGAAVVILKNTSGKLVPSLSLMEAATFEMCHSPCWENKVLAQVYWVHAH
jgi:predicted ribosome quality control (RQC) complex YloA/Tae2 family protein